MLIAKYFENSFPQKHIGRLQKSPCAAQKFQSWGPELLLDFQIFVSVFTHDIDSPDSKFMKTA